jgi:D-threonate/D-erythronate kinase
MLEIAVIADDLTGAADTGIQFRPMFAEVQLMADTALDGDVPVRVPKALAIHTRTRAMAPKASHTKMTDVARRLLAWQPRRVYKKVDSCLRGNIGAETDALIEMLGLEMSFIAPAFPAAGRTTVHDIHFMHGQPVAESQMRKDFATPVTESRLTRVIAAQSRLAVGRIDLDTVAAGAGPLADEVSRLAKTGVRHIVFDAVEQDHLSTIAGLTLARFPATLLVGSAGLALGLRESLGGPLLEPAPVPARKGSHLFALGTTCESAGRQVAALCRARDAKIFDFEALSLAQPLEEMDITPLVARLQVGDAVVRIVPKDHVSSATTALQVAAGFGGLVAEAVRRTHPTSIFLSGGDTAVATLDSLGVKTLRLELEIVPGLVFSTAAGGPFDGLAVATKPGAFGDDNAILEWRTFWS